MAYPLLHPKSQRDVPLILSEDGFAAEFRESTFVEFKSGIGAKTIRETAVAFANADGGLIFIGVSDDGRITRRTEKTPEVEDALHEALKPIIGLPRYELRELMVGAMPTTIVVVWPAIEGFAQTPDGRVLKRTGSRDDALVGNRLMTFVAERATARHQVEQQPTTWTVDEADSVLTARMEAARGWKSWRGRGLSDRVGLSRDGMLTVAGALLLRPDPHAHLGRAYVEVLRFPDDTTITYDLRRAFYGPVDDQVRDVSAFVDELLGFEMAFQDTRRIEIPRLPPRVVRETVANAIAHRSYEQSGSCVSVELRPGLVAVRSPGGLPAGVIVERLREEQHSRNPVVLDALRHYHLAEQRGMGIDLIEDAMQAAMLEPPQFVDHGHRFDVELPLNSTVSVDERAWIMVLTEEGRLEPGDQAVLVYATRGEELTNSRVRELLRIDERRARGALHRLCTAGLLERHGTRAGTRYRLAGDHAERVEDGLKPEDVASVVLRLAVSRGPLSNADVREATGVDRGEALAILDQLVDDGRLLRVGERRWTRYRLSGKP